MSASVKDIDDYTVERLRMKCKREGRKGYGVMNKEQLYAYCVLGRDLDEVLEMRVKTSRTLKARTPSPRAKVSKMEAKLSPKRASKWDVCVSSKRHARECIDRLIDKYPELFTDICEPVVEGPAAGLIVEGKRVIGIATPEGEIKAVEGTVMAPDPPPAPPAPPAPAPMAPPAPVVSTIPKVRVPSDPKGKAALKKDLAEARAEGMAIEADALKAQMKRLKALQKAEIKGEVPSQTQIGRLMQEIRTKREAREARTAAEAESVEVRIARRRRETLARLQEERVRAGEDPKEAHLRAIRGAKLKKTKKCKPPTVYDGKKRKCVECSEYGLVYDPRLKRCVVTIEEPITDVQPPPTADPKYWARLAAEREAEKEAEAEAVEGGIDETLAEMEEEREEGETGVCTIM